MVLNHTWIILFSLNLNVDFYEKKFTSNSKGLKFALKKFKSFYFTNVSNLQWIHWTLSRHIWFSFGRTHVCDDDDDDGEDGEEGCSCGAAEGLLWGEEFPKRAADSVSLNQETHRRKNTWNALWNNRRVILERSAFWLIYSF